MGLSTHWSGLSFPSPGNLLDSGIKPRSPELQADSCIAGIFFTHWATREASIKFYLKIKLIFLKNWRKGHSFGIGPLPHLRSVLSAVCLIKDMSAWAVRKKWSREPYGQTQKTTSAKALRWERAPWHVQGITLRITNKQFCFVLLATTCSMWDLSSPTRDWTRVPCSGRAES